MELIISFVMPECWLHFTACALALSSSLASFLTVPPPPPTVIENGYGSTKSLTFTPTLRPAKSSCGPPVPRSPETHTDWTGLGHMSISEPITVWLGVEPTDCSIPGLKAKSPQRTAGRAGGRSY